jgi:urea transport system ATP-binding protein
LRRWASAAKFQKPTVFEQLTVFENLELALKTDKGVKPSMFFRLDSGQGDRLADRSQGKGESIR